MAEFDQWALSGWPPEAIRYAERTHGSLAPDIIIAPPGRIPDDSMPFAQTASIERQEISDEESMKGADYATHDAASEGYVMQAVASLMPR
jgi:hypothetical protein